MTTAAAWLCIEKLFKLVDKSGTGKLNLLVPDTEFLCCLLGSF